MAEFTGDFSSFKPTLPFMEMDSNMLINQFGELNQSFLGNPNLGFSNDNFLTQPQSSFPVNLGDNLPGFFYTENSKAMQGEHSLISAENVHQENRKQKAMLVSDTSSGNSSTPVLHNALVDNNKTKKKSNVGRGKRGRKPEKELEKPKEVIHVRARRGQATDSHSLAERVRREKINEKLRCLQDLVPGCYKTMGMAVMLDEIITYVQSLQNQVEFLSMKLTAASTFYDFNNDVEVTPTMQGTQAYEAHEMERLLREGGYGGVSSFHTSWPL